MRTLAALSLAAMSAPQASEPAIERGRALSDWSSVASITALTEAANAPLKAAIASGEPARFTALSIDGRSATAGEPVGGQTIVPDGRR